MNFNEIYKKLNSKNIKVWNISLIFLEFNLMDLFNEWNTKPITCDGFSGFENLLKFRINIEKIEKLPNNLIINYIDFSYTNVREFQENFICNGYNIQLNNFIKYISKNFSFIKLKRKILKMIVFL